MTRTETRTETQTDIETRVLLMLILVVVRRHERGGARTLPIRAAAIGEHVNLAAAVYCSSQPLIIVYVAAIVAIVAETAIGAAIEASIPIRRDLILP